MGEGVDDAVDSCVVVTVSGGALQAARTATAPVSAMISRFL